MQTELSASVEMVVWIQAVISELGGGGGVHRNSSFKDCVHKQQKKVSEIERVLISDNDNSWAIKYADS